MSKGRLLDYDPEMKRAQVFHYNEEDGSFTIETTQDVQSIVDLNKAEEAGQSSLRRYPGDGLHKIASLPLNIYMKLQREGILDDEKAFKRWLNDPDNRVFRTKPGRV